LGTKTNQIPDAAWKLARRRERIVAPLADRDHVTESEVEQAGKALRLGMRMVFRLIAYYRRKRCTSVLVPETRGRKCGSRILDPGLEKIIETAIKDFYLRREKPSLASLHQDSYAAFFCCALVLAQRALCRGNYGVRLGSSCAISSMPPHCLRIAPLSRTGFRLSAWAATHRT
jgi:hypothetical protein